MGNKVLSYRDLEVWKRAVAFVSTIYQVTARFPAHEQFNLTSQIRRAAVSIPANIAEGSMHSTKGFLNHLRIARGSLAELDTFMEICRNLAYLTSEEYQALTQEMHEIRRMLFGLERTLRRIDY